MGYGQIAGRQLPSTETQKPLGKFSNAGTVNRISDAG
jgi:hypothetical protein